MPGATKSRSLQAPARLRQLPTALSSSVGASPTGIDVAAAAAILSSKPRFRGQYSEGLLVAGRTSVSVANLVPVVMKECIHWKAAPSKVQAWPHCLETTCDCLPK